DPTHGALSRVGSRSIELSGHGTASMRRAGRGAALAVVFLSGLTSLAAPTMAQDSYPNRPVKIIAPQGPGGGVDLVARIIADKLHVAMGQPFVVENIAGAGGAIATQSVARAQPDGYTLMIGYVAPHALH